MDITDDIKEALEAAVEQSGSAVQFAEGIGISHTTVARWISGETKSINQRIWESTVHPVLLPYLKFPEAIPHPKIPRSLAPYIPQRPPPHNESPGNAKFQDAMSSIVRNKLAQLTPSQINSVITIMMAELSSDQIVSIVAQIDQMIENTRSQMVEAAFAAREKKGEYKVKDKNE